MTFTHRDGIEPTWLPRQREEVGAREATMGCEDVRVHQKMIHVLVRYLVLVLVAQLYLRSSVPTRFLRWGAVSSRVYLFEGVP